MHNKARILTGIKLLESSVEEHLKAAVGFLVPSFFLQLLFVYVFYPYSCTGTLTNPSP